MAGVSPEEGSVSPVQPTELNYRLIQKPEDNIL